MSDRQYKRVANRRLRRAVAWLIRELIRDLNGMLREGLPR